MRMSAGHRNGGGYYALLIQVASVIVGGAAVIGIAFYTSSIVDRSSHRTLDNAQGALLSAEIVSEIDSMTLTLVFNTGTDSQTLEIAFDTLSQADAVVVHDAIERAQANADDLHTLIGTERTLQIKGAAAETREAIDAYIASPSLDTFLAGLVPPLGALRFLAADESPRLDTAAQEDHATLLRATSIAKFATIIAMLISVFCVGAATFFIGKRLRKALLAAQSEQEQLVVASAAMQRRNEQFSALYQVVSEVSETLSMAYVLQTTTREARNLVGAESVVVRRLIDNELVFAGTDHDAGAATDNGESIPLGTGLVGRAAKRGKTVRIDEGAASQRCPAEGFPEAQSALIVPLIVGARVVGTLACWSRKPHQFNTDDERILEMMASQVATAIAAAGLHEESQRDAHHDALTLLANRRQLSEDLRGFVQEEAAKGTLMAVTMIDIDHFKRFNDDYGHRVGDIALQKVSEVLRASVREQDHIYRFGGEEFIIIFLGVGAAMAMQLAERARAAVERTTLTGESLEPVGPITISLGVALFPEHGTDIEALIDRADRAMYSSKEMGRNRVTLYAHRSEDFAAAA